METKPITVRVNAEAARIFETAPEEERRKIEALLSLKLTEATKSLHGTLRSPCGSFITKQC